MYFNYSQRFTYESHLTFRYFSNDIFISLIVLRLCIILGVYEVMKINFSLIVPLMNIKYNYG